MERKSNTPFMRKNISSQQKKRVPKRGPASELEELLVKLFQLPVSMFPANAIGPSG